MNANATLLRQEIAKYLLKIMVNENLIPKTETVYEIKDEYKIPSFEEFMKTYENDGNLNYDDLNSDIAGEAKGYGPCPNSNQDKATARGIGVGAAIATGVLSFFCPPAGLAVAGTYAAIGTAAKVTSHVAKDERVRDGAEIFDITFGFASKGGLAKDVNKGAGFGGNCINHVHK